MSNSEFLEEILFEGYRLGIIDPLMNEAKIEIDKGVYAHPCDAYFSVLVKMIKEMDIKESTFYHLSTVS
jgi:hypothetical protein